MSWITRLRNVFRKDDLDRDLDDELQFHAEQRAADLGLTPAEAQRRLGHTARILEESRDVKLARWLETVLQDLRLAFRIWRKRPLVAVTAILTIALGAGMNVAVFRVIWNVMLKPLPYAEPARLMQVWVEEKEPRTPPENVLIDKWQHSSLTFSAFAAYRPWSITIIGQGNPEQVFTGMVSRNFFETLGTPLLAGRAFTPDEMSSGSDNAILLREGYWRRRFAGDPGLVGSEIEADGTLCRVIGIVPDSFLATPLIQVARGGSTALGGARAEPDAFMPLSRARVGGMRLPTHTSFLIGRLNPGIPAGQAANELAAIAGPGERRRIWLSPLEEEVGYQLRPALLALIAATGCVLLIACANLANLMLAQVVLRRRELAVRAALGAGMSRVMRQLVTEAMALSLAGGAAGLLLSQLLYGVIVGLYPDTIPRTANSAPDWIIYLFALGLTILTGLLFGVLPAWRAASEAKEEALRVGNPWMSRGSRRWSSAMVALQAGLTTVVLIAAGLLARTFLTLRDIDIGIDRDHILTASIDLPATRYKTRDDRARFGRAWLDRLNAIPGVASAGISNSLPLRYTMLLDLRIFVPGSDQEQLVGGRAVGGDYFKALGMRWAAGGPFDPAVKGQVAVNEAFVRKFLKDKQPVGFQLPQGKTSMLITGVIKDVRHRGLREAPQPELYLSYDSFPLNPVDTVIRSNLPTAQIIAAMRRELKALDDQVVLARPLAMEEVVNGELARPRFQVVLLGLFAGVALALAAIGTYGVIAYNVRSRTPELGLRRALGASTLNIQQLILAGGLKAPMVGLAAGLLLGWLVIGRLLEAMLYGVTARDPKVLIFTAVTLAATSLSACLLPGRAAARIDPGVALRQE
ncbi:ADOP family duplicated permease [Paludibaculum fermentans]|uniref:ABC transporter permease n=1 Tax=Paludibaculum fermentans TaxID=1473598 RepID=A0A7S7NVW3_PALFE|nr:ADOP family duplicated permease [Paludibaculum fermentans]QOY90769.1 ABC transporter permease [Paludibaculum fermentans]